MHVYNDAQLTAALADGIAGEESALGEIAESLGEKRVLLHIIGSESEN